jgi:hypothetical protein
MVLEWMNLFDLFVNNVFGAVWLANLGVGVLLILIGYMTRQSNSIIYTIILFYAVALGLVWVPLATVLMFVLGFIYMAAEIMLTFIRRD